MHRRSVSAILAASLVLSACVGTAAEPSATSVSATNSPESATPGSSAAATATATATESPAPSPTAEPTATPEPIGGVYSGSAGGVVDPSIADLPHRVYVPNETSNDIAVIDPETFEVIDRFAVGSAPEHSPRTGTWARST